jgi:hypothetical protein
LEYGLHHPVDIGVHVGIPEAENSKAFALENGVTDLIVRPALIARMLTAIDLDHYSPVEADEVEVVAAEGRLAADVKAELAPHQAQSRPQPRLLRR